MLEKSLVYNGPTIKTIFSRSKSSVQQLLCHNNLN